MKFASVALPLLAFVTYVAAQASYIGYPPAGAVVYEGQEVTVQIIKDVRYPSSNSFSTMRRYTHPPLHRTA
jgi:hypothetical protein